ncbi:DNA polymerase III subunit epsilon [Nitrosomonas communis]|uniref:DNA polymerase III subunit epsilon n=1 Tax=Nitrosomonas communis TaxID=44574 RepID=A0A1H2TBN3_9PROT|nr:DNA polymerase III subunit epsilon [Nitrosomonas communis]SDW40649.1 DNA polymerase-3 subunit epsilon [Nitrosomonas communis]
MRKVFIDTETTGLDPKLGHRIVEIAAVEMYNRQLTGRHFHYYLNPERESEASALQIHGLTSEFLQDKQKFRDICAAFLDFIEGAELLIHNAPFDVGFLDHELGLVKQLPLKNYCSEITDTLIIAKEIHPGKRNNLDALCERYQIDNSKRTLHGALMDAELLAEVYLAMTRGQESLLMELDITPLPIDSAVIAENLHLIILPAGEKELELHSQQLENIDKESKGKCLWKHVAFSS